MIRRNRVPNQASARRHARLARWRPSSLVSCSLPCRMAVSPGTHLNLQYHRRHRRGQVGSSHQVTFPFLKRRHPSHRRGAPYRQRRPNRRRDDPAPARRQRLRRRPRRLRGNRSAHLLPRSMHRRRRRHARPEPRRHLQSRRRVARRAVALLPNRRLAEVLVAVAMQLRSRRHDAALGTVVSLKQRRRRRHGAAPVVITAS